MNFCQECGTRMKITKTSYICPKCGNLLPIRMVEAKKIHRTPTNAIFIVEGDRKLGPKVSQVCPKCGNDQAYQWLSSINGEHAGVTQERTWKNYRCTKCHFSWGESH